MTEHARAIKRASDAFKARVSDAARRHASTQDEHSTGYPAWFGAPWGFSFTRSVEGEISNADFDQLVAIVRRLLRSNGEVTQGDRHLEWTSDLDIVFVKVVPDVDETTVEIRLDAAWDAIATFVMTGIVVLVTIVSAAVQSADGIGFPFVAAFLVGGYVVARLIWRAFAHWSVRKLKRVLATVTQRIEDIVRSRGSTPVPAE